MATIEPSLLKARPVLKARNCAEIIKIFPAYVVQITGPATTKQADIDFVVEIYRKFMHQRLGFRANKTTWCERYEEGKLEHMCIAFIFFDECQARDWFNLCEGVAAGRVYIGMKYANEANIKPGQVRFFTSYWARRATVGLEEDATASNTIHYDVAPYEPRDTEDVPSGNSEEWRERERYEHHMRLVELGGAELGDLYALNSTGVDSGMPPGALIAYCLLFNMIVSSWSPTDQCEICHCKLEDHLGHTIFCPCHPAVRHFVELCIGGHRQHLITRLYVVPTMVSKKGIEITSPFEFADSLLAQVYLQLYLDDVLREAYLMTHVGQVMWPVMRDIVALAMFVDLPDIRRTLSTALRVDKNMRKDHERVKTPPAVKFIEVGLFNPAELMPEDALQAEFGKLPERLAATDKPGVISMISDAIEGGIIDKFAVDSDGVAFCSFRGFEIAPGAAIDYGGASLETNDDVETFRDKAQAGTELAYRLGCLDEDALMALATSNSFGAKGAADKRIAKALTTAVNRRHRNISTAVGFRLHGLRTFMDRVEKDEGDFVNLAKEAGLFDFLTIGLNNGRQDELVEAAFEVGAKEHADRVKQGFYRRAPHERGFVPPPPRSDTPASCRLRAQYIDRPTVEKTEEQYDVNRLGEYNLPPAKFARFRYTPLDVNPDARSRFGFSYRPNIIMDMGAERNTNREDARRSYRHPDPDKNDERCRRLRKAFEVSRLHTNQRVLPNPNAPQPRQRDESPRMDRTQHDGATIIIDHRRRSQSHHRHHSREHRRDFKKSSRRSPAPTTSRNEDRSRRHETRREKFDKSRDMKGSRSQASRSQHSSKDSRPSKHSHKSTHQSKLQASKSTQALLRQLRHVAAPQIIEPFERQLGFIDLVGHFEQQVACAPQQARSRWPRRPPSSSRRR